MIATIEKIPIQLLQHAYWQQFAAFALGQLKYPAVWYLHAPQFDKLQFEFEVFQHAEGVTFKLIVSNVPAGISEFEQDFISLLESLVRRHVFNTGNPISELKGATDLYVGVILNYLPTPES